MVIGVCGVYRKGQEGLDDGIRRAWVIWTCGRLLAEVAYHAVACLLLLLLVLVLV